MKSQRLNALADGMMSKLTRRRALRRLASGAGLAAAAAAAGSVRLRVSAQDATPPVAAADQAGYLVIRTYRYQPGGTIEQVVERVQEGFVPIITAVPGFVEYFIVDLGPEQQLSLSIFTDQAGADESVRRAAGWVEENLTDVVQSPPEVVAGEIRLHVPPGAVEASTPTPA
jgi:hypothetical protein